MHACSGVMHAHTHAYAHIQEPMCMFVDAFTRKMLKAEFCCCKTTNLWETQDKVHSHIS